MALMSGLGEPWFHYNWFYNLKNDYLCEIYFLRDFTSRWILSQVHVCSITDLETSEYNCQLWLNNTNRKVEFSFGRWIFFFGSWIKISYCYKTPTWTLYTSGLVLSKSNERYFLRTLGKKMVYAEFTTRKK